MKNTLLSFLLFGGLVPLLLANTAPTPVIVSAAMRPGTTYLDVVFRVNDPDDATVRVRPLVFVNGVRSSANVIRPVTFIGDTSAALGDNVSANVDHTLTWDVAADWDVAVGQLKFEILCLDARGLVNIDWISIPAAGENPALTISKDTLLRPLEALFWEYASGGDWVILVDGQLRGGPASGIFSGLPLLNGTSLSSYARPFIAKRMNLAPTRSGDLAYANNVARAGLLNPADWHAVDRPYDGLSLLVGWGQNTYGQVTVPANGFEPVGVAGGNNHTLVLKSDGTVLMFGNNSAGGGPAGMPAGLGSVAKVVASFDQSYAIRTDGSLVAWSNNSASEVPPDLGPVIAVTGGPSHTLVVKPDGTVTGWGASYSGLVPPVGLTGVVNLSGGPNFMLALKSDGTVVAWGSNASGQISLPAGLTGVIAVAAGGQHGLALKQDGTVVAWGQNSYGQATVPAGLSGVVAIAAGENHSLALKADGTVVAWGWNSSGQCNVPAGLQRVVAIAAGARHSLAVLAEEP